MNMTAEDARNNERAKKVYVGVIILLIFMFVGLFIYSFRTVMAMEGQFPDMFEQLTESKIAEPATPEDAVKLLKTAVDAAVEKKPLLSVEKSFSIDGGSVESDLGDSSAEVLRYISDSVEEVLENAYEPKTVNYSEDMSGVIVLPDFNAADVEEFTCTYKYYRCASCGETSDAPLENCEKCGYAFPYSLKYNDEYSCELILKPSAKIKKIFDDRTGDDIISMLMNGANGYAVISSVDVGYDIYRVLFSIDRVSGKISRMELIKEMNASASAALAGGYASLGNINASAAVTEKNSFRFTWPGISLSAHEMIIEPGSTDNLLATLICDDPLEYSVTWTSSDPGTAEVDDEGYVDAKKAGEGKTAVITATYEFNGETYSDSCSLTVRHPVESMKLSKRNLKMAKGDTFGLSAKFTPSKATCTEVRTWISTDENVITVDAAGVITAVGEGSASVIAYSEDGFFKSTCEVTVR